MWMYFERMMLKSLKMNHSLFFLVILLFYVYKVSNCENTAVETPEEEMYGVKYAQECEVCKYLVVELENRLSETGKSREVLEMGYQLDPSTKKKKKYAVSELRLVESLEGICERLLTYNIHKERKDSTRFAKGMSTTFKVLHELVDKGVKVELGIPEELWDKPSAEVTNLKMKCENLLERHEADIENWYFKHQDVPLQQYLCVDRALRKGDTDCLNEAAIPSEEKEKGEKTEKKPKKSKSKNNDVKINKDKNDKSNKKGETREEL